jgi:hypothetical protein
MNQVKIKPVRWGRRRTSRKNSFEYHLSGTSRDRRKQLREINKMHLGWSVELIGRLVQKEIDGEYVWVEDANRIRTTVLVTKK